MDSSKKKSEANVLVQGSILAIASMISRVIGLVYRIPLNGILGNHGMDYYGTAFEIYNVLLIISAYSLPLAVSKLVSARLSKGQRVNAYRMFKGALTLALISGGTASLILYFGAPTFTAMLKTPLSVFALKVLAPTILVVAVLGVIRGFFQGLGTMMPSAVSQIVEQIMNAIVSVAAAFILFGYGSRIGAVLGNSEDYGAAYGAAGGTLGTNMGALFGLLFVGFLFLAYKPIFKRQMRRDKSRKRESYSEVFHVLLWTIVPVLMSTTIYNISGIIDQGIFKNIATLQGYKAKDISNWWGIFTGKYKTITNIPISIASAMAASCVPSLTAAFSVKDKKSVKRQINSSIRFIMVIAFPCAMGIGVLASPVMQLLFNDSSELAANMLRAGAISVVFYSMSTLSNGLLQGINRMKAPVRNAAIALVIHIAFLLMLLFGFRLNIYAVIYANAFFAFVMCVLNAISIKKYSGYRQEVIKTFLIPFLSSAVMGVVIFFVYKGIFYVFPHNKIVTLIDIGIGAVVYFVALLLMKGIDEEELLRFPKGHLLVKIAHKMHLLR
ncbi:MAG: polysaccharide biosynthesis protein [Lachnospiraceae bacterium]|nr:polysaccharide biosynthesis protein [Lachnospiraceae bacterium]